MMKKKVFSLFLSVVAVLILCSCNLIANPTITTTSTTPKPTVTTDPATLPPYLRGETVKGHELTYEFNETEYNAFVTELADAKRKCENEVDFNEFHATYKKAEEVYNKIVQAYKVEYLEYCLYGKDESQEKYLEFQNKSTDIVQWVNEVEHMAYKNSFKGLLYEDMTDEEILAAIGKEYPEAYYNIRKELDQISADFLSLDNSKGSYPSDAERLTIAYVNKANELNPYLGETYFSNSYKTDYLRDFTPTDTDNYFKYVMQYTLPAYKRLDSSLSRLTSSEKELYYKLFGNGSKPDVFLTDFDEVEAYKESMGGVIKEAFDNLFKDGGYYYITYDNNGYDGAFQDTLTDGTPYVLYGTHYHDPFTVVHEFGHYTAATKNASHTCYDLCETQSQANELLFALDFINRHNASDNLKNAIINNKFKDFYSSVIVCAIVNEVEKYCYAQSPMKTGDIDAKVDAMFNEYGLTAARFSKEGVKTYCKSVMVYSPAYYISYSTSIVGSLDVFKMATESFAKGKEAYLKLIDYDFSIKGYRDVYAQAGLHDPFSEECFQYIFS